MRIENRMQLQLWREECKEKRQKENCCILVCGGTGCLAGGSDKIYARLKELTSNMDHVTVKIGEEIAHVGLKMSGCHGFCEMGPLVRIEPYNYLYLKVKLEDCEEIFEKTILHGKPVTRLMYEDNGHVYQTQEEIPFYAKQTRLVLRNCGHIDAEHIEDAMAVGAYESFEKAVFEMTPEAVIKTVTDAGLRGRGGAGFPAGRKWSQVASQPEKIRYVVCNGDEGDPGAFMDRSVMEGDPHQMIEGMMLAAYAVQAQEGYITFVQSIRWQYEDCRSLSLRRKRKDFWERISLGQDSASNYISIAEQVLLYAGKVPRLQLRSKASEACRE